MAADPLADVLDTAPLAAAPAGTDPDRGGAARVTAAADAVEGAVIGLRRWFHAHPEASLEETGTAAAVAAQLEIGRASCRERVLQVV